MNYAIIIDLVGRGGRGYQILSSISLTPNIDEDWILTELQSLGFTEAMIITLFEQICKDDVVMVQYLLKNVAGNLLTTACKNHTGGYALIQDDIDRYILQSKTSEAIDQGNSN